ncbi:hypothetical protein ECHHL_0717 [Ehrlichia chaffeensis str. Heartland]|uniref:hypothetical protein n=1 Tax=Ehrlichia chaffeensis TaxID=945 RepID=UPI000053A074|nr:hypothetical protein [Ehrlichia chaffeensis]AHX03864.1 hypothetical protein ECHHL_0717 [Ehrlichia chaffeensis str. Heartland]AHX10551.1 hypothetical protein ECHWP_0713 [Ehrlichia chaffeensis str. West Paces]
MFYPTRDLKTIYSKDNTVCVENILEMMNGTSEELQAYKDDLLSKHKENTKQKLADQKKSQEEIALHIASPSFSEEALAYVNYTTNQHILKHLSDSKHIGKKTRILIKCLEPLEHQRRNMIMEGMYKASLLKEFNQIMQDASDDDFEALVNIIISCSHLKTDLTEQQQKNIEAAIATYNREEQGLSLQSIREFINDTTGIDISNPLSSIKKKLGGKKEDIKQPLESLDEKLINVITSPYSVTYFILGTLTLGLGGFAGPLLPILLIVTVGKSLHGMLTEDKEKEGTIHSPFQEGVLKPSRISEKPQNYTAILEQQHKQEEDKQQDTSKPHTSRHL